jgi:hypothetical protein
MAGIRVEGSVSGNVAEVDTNNNLKTNLPTAIAQSGFAALAGKNDDGTVVSGGRINRVYVSEGFGLSTAVKYLLWDDTFNATAQNTSKYKFLATTQTGAMAGGYLILNNSAIVTANTNCAVQTTRTFPIFAKAELRVNFSLVKTIATQANETYEVGLFQAALPGAAIPTDGVFFRWNTSAELRGVVNYNGTETQTAAITSASINVNHDYVIVVQTNTVLFYIDDILVGKLTLLTDAPSQGQPIMAAAVPLTMRYYIGATPPSLASQMKISDVFVTSLGPDMERPWSQAKAGMGHMAYQGQNGGTMGSTAAITNSQAGGAGAALTNTTTVATGLGGQAGVLPTLAVGTDGIVTSFQVPVGGINQTPRNLIITGVWIQGAVSTALTGGAVGYQYQLAFGHTAVSMATTETASFVSPSTKAPRRIFLGCESYAAAAPLGTIGQGVFRQFQNPIVVAPGEFIAVTAKNNGVVTTAGVILISVGFDAYYE